MKFNLFLLATIFVAVSSNAAPVLGTGTAGNAALKTGPSPSFGEIFNFDSLTANSTFSPGTYAAQGVNISSPDGLVVYPYSTQSGPNYLFDNSAAGSANIVIKTFGVSEIGIGIADSDVSATNVPVTISLQALNSSGVGFGSIFNVTITDTGINAGNGYVTLSDSTADIYGLQILQPVSNAALYSGLAIDDLQVAPEPSTWALLGAGALLAGATRLRKRA